MGLMTAPILSLPSTHRMGLWRVGQDWRLVQFPNVGTIISTTLYKNVQWKVSDLVRLARVSPAG